MLLVSRLMHITLFLKWMRRSDASTFPCRGQGCKYNFGRLKSNLVHIIWDPHSTNMRPTPRLLLYYSIHATYSLRLFPWNWQQTKKINKYARRTMQISIFHFEALRTSVKRSVWSLSETLSPSGFIIIIPTIPPHRHLCQVCRLLCWLTSLGCTFWQQCWFRTW